VPLTLLVLIIMENFEGTRPLAILMRYTGEENKKKERGGELMKGLWGKVRERSVPIVFRWTVRGAGRTAAARAPTRRPKPGGEVNENRQVTNRE